MKRRQTTLSIVTVMVAALTWAAASGAEEPEPPAGGAAALETEGERRSSDMIGALRHVVTAYEDTLLDLARANGLGYVEMIAANQGIDPWVPGENTPIVLPTAHVLPDAERQGLVVNLAEHRLYYFGPEGTVPQTFPLGVGKEGWATPLGSTEIVRKKERPTWFPPESIRAEKPHLPKAVPPGPYNPLGSHALYFRLAKLSDSRHEHAVGSRAAGQPRMHPPLSRGYRAAVRAGANWYAGAGHQSGRSRSAGTAVSSMWRHTPRPNRRTSWNGPGKLRASTRALAPTLYSGSRL